MVVKGSETRHINYIAWIHNPLYWLWGYDLIKRDQAYREQQHQKNQDLDSIKVVASDLSEFERLVRI